MKISIIRDKNKNYSIDTADRKSRITLSFVLLLFCLIFGIGIWGLANSVELLQLREKTRLQDEQIKLFEEKINVLDEKMKTLEMLDNEIRQIITGSEQGSLPQGGGEPLSSIKQNSVQGQANEASNVNTLLASLHRLSARSESYLQSLYTVRSLLKSGGTDQIKSWQNQMYLANRTGQDVQRPSIWPAAGVITSLYGVRQDPIDGRSSYHEGIDIANTYNTPILSTAAGIVSFSGYNYGYGNLVEIVHGNGISTRYGHNAVILVKTGQEVKKGEPIALMGSTGKSTGAHVHYEVRINNSPVNPMLYLTE